MDSTLASGYFKNFRKNLLYNVMGPKKKERDTDHSSSSKGGGTNGRADSVQADHELFLQAFESKNIYFLIDFFSNASFVIEHT